MKQMFAWMPCAILCVLGGAGTSRAADVPPNSISCTQFHKLPDGGWRTEGAEFSFGMTRHMHLDPQDIHENQVNVNRADLYTAIQQKCGTGKHKGA